MFESLTAIVLRTFQNGRLCLFTRPLGKIYCFNQRVKQPFIAGSIATIRLIEKNATTFHVDHLDNIHYPEISTAQELAWLHHLLELYYFFLSEHQASPSDYDFFTKYLVFAKCSAEQTTHFQKLAVSHFLAQTGFYEQPALHRYARIFEEVIDHATQPTVPSSIIGSEECSMHDLILRCLQEHPQFHLFKTIPFLYKAST